MRLGFTVHHNGPPAKCVGQAHSRCIAFWNAVKRFHMESNGWSDIAYSFGVCPHGVRFEGRGWFKNQFANGADVVGPNDGKDSEWYTVLVFLGGDEKPTAEMVEGVKNLIIDGRSTGRCGQRVLPHNAFKPKACPGPEFTALAAVWDNNPTLGAGQQKDEFMAALNESEQRELLNRVRALTPFPLERINRSGVQVAEGGFVAHPTVRYSMDTMRLIQALDIKGAVKTALEGLNVAEATADEIATAILAALKEKL